MPGTLVAVLTFSSNYPTTGEHTGLCLRRSQPREKGEPNGLPSLFGNAWFEKAFAAQAGPSPARSREMMAQESGDAAGAVLGFGQAGIVFEDMPHPLIDPQIDLHTRGAQLP